MYSSSEENYLKAVYHLQLSGGKVSTNALARQLNTRPASVTDMMKKLHAKDLLHYTPYYGFTLSAEGKKAALHIVRRHRLWEAFLAEKLEISADEVHEIAEELEHVRNPKLIEKLDAFLGRPQFDPHGGPIPDRRGKVPRTTWVPLAEVAPHQPVALRAIRGGTKQLTKELAGKNLKVGSRLHINTRYAFDQSLEINTEGQNFLITAQLATHLLVEKV